MGGTLACAGLAATRLFTSQMPLVVRQLGGPEQRLIATHQANAGLAAGLQMKERGRPMGALHLDREAQPFAIGGAFEVPPVERVHQSSSSSSATARTLSRVKPKCSNSAGAGADSPKLVMPMMRPSRPTYLYQ